MTIAVALLACNPRQAPVALDPSRDLDGDGFASDIDCNDGDPTTHPGASEPCDARDNDCDGVVDAGAHVVGGVEVYPDLDHDDWGVSAGTAQVCSMPAPDFATRVGDCNDHDSMVNPSAAERCNGRDDNCDGETDEGWTADGYLFYVDADGDRFGDPARPERACADPGDAWADVGGDCNDSDPTVHPGARDYCDDGVDQDCNAGGRSCPFHGMVVLGDTERAVRSDGTTDVGFSGKTALAGRALILSSSSLEIAGVYLLPSGGAIDSWDDSYCDFSTTIYLAAPIDLGGLGADVSGGIAFNVHSEALGLEDVEPADLTARTPVALAGLVAEIADCSWRTVLLAGTKAAPVGITGLGALPDLDSDGAADVWVTGREAWWVSGALVGAGGTLYMGTSAEAMITGAPALQVFGAVDRDGDGVAGELLVGTGYYDGWRGGAWLLPIDDLLGEVTLDEVAAVTFQADGATQDLLGAAGDVLDFDGDGYEEVAIGSRHPPPGSGEVINGGRVYVFNGAEIADGPTPVWGAEWQFYNDGTSNALGRAGRVHSGDLDADRLDDLFLSDTDSHEPCDFLGGVLLWYGGLAPGEYAPGSRDACFTADSPGAAGAWVGVGDMDEDGVLDLLFSVPSSSTDWGGIYRTEGW